MLGVAGTAFCLPADAGGGPPRQLITDLVCSLVIPSEVRDPFSIFGVTLNPLNPSSGDASFAPKDLKHGVSAQSTADNGTIFYFPISAVVTG